MCVVHGFTHILPLVPAVFMMLPLLSRSVLFRQYDTDNSGAIDEREFRELAKTVNNASPMFPGNFAKALLDFDT